jgi:hypothetical protein
MRALTLLLITTFLTAAAADEPSRAEGDEAAAPSPDLTGYRLCPSCHTLNPPAAEYCMRCGALLDESAGAAVGRKAPAVRRCVLAPMFSAGTPYYLGARAQARFNWKRIAYEPAYAYYPREEYDDRYGDDTEPHRLENLVRFYFGGAQLRPFATADVRFQYRYVRRPVIYPYPFYSATHFFELTPTVGGGVNFNYGGRGSFLEAAAGLGAAVFWSSYDRDPDGRVSFAFDIQNVTFVNRYVGVWARAAVTTSSRKYRYFPENVVLVGVGPALSW